MMVANNEFNDAASDKFDFLVNEYDFNVSIKAALGTYHSEIVFNSNFLEIELGVWGQGNELWFIFKPLLSRKVPEFTLQELLNGITGDKNYFDENISNKTEWPVFTHTFPEYFERCAVELRKHCERIFAGDLSQWVEIAKQVLVQRVEWMLILSQNREILGLSERDKWDMDPLVRYIKSHDPDFPLTGVENAILDKLTK